MSLLNKAIANVQARKPRDTEALLELIAADSSTVISPAEMMRIKQAFSDAGAKLPYFSDPSELVAHVHALLS
jgi:hypothetical protein